MLGTACGLALVCGVNAYLPLFVLGFMSRTGNAALQSGFDWLRSPVVLTAVLILAFADFVADKVPRLDHVWDVIHTFARPVAAILCVAAILNTNSELTRTLIALIGGLVGGSVHSSKAAVRLMSSTASGGLLSAPVSSLEDLLAVLLLILSFAAPRIMLALGAVVLACFIWIAPTLWYALRLQWHVLRGLFSSLIGGTTTETPESVRQRSLFRLPDWALVAVNGVAGPDDPLRSAVPVTVHGMRLPHHAWLVVSEQRLILVGRTAMRRVKLYELPLLYIRVARLERGWLFPSLKLLDLDGKRLRLRFVEANELLIQDVTDATLASLPPDARKSISDAPPTIRRIG